MTDLGWTKVTSEGDCKTFSSCNNYGFLLRKYYDNQSVQKQNLQFRNNENFIMEVLATLLSSETVKDLLGEEFLDKE